jgi:hypothetical protein
MDTAGDRLALDVVDREPQLARAIIGAGQRGHQ